jgi:hypothetical protein
MPSSNSIVAFVPAKLSFYYNPAPLQQGTQPIVAAKRGSGVASNNLAKYRDHVVIDSRTADRKMQFSLYSSQRR